MQIKNLSKYQCGFGTGCIAHCLVAMLEKRKDAVDNNVFGALLTDLSKAFDCLSHEQIITNLNVYEMFKPYL